MSSLSLHSPRFQTQRATQAPIDGQASSVLRTCEGVTSPWQRSLTMVCFDVFDGALQTLLSVRTAGWENMGFAS